MDSRLTVCRGTQGEPDGAIDGHGQHEANVGVGVFPDQVDPPGRADQELGFTTKARGIGLTHGSGGICRHFFHPLTPVPLSTAGAQQRLRP